MMKKVFTMALAMVFPVAAWSADFDTFQAKTEEGVLMTFRVISEAKKTCQVGQDNVFYSSVNINTSGTITIPSSVNGYTVTTIGGYSFSKCNKITSIIIPNTVENISIDAFAGESFNAENLTSLNSINIPSSVKYIGSYAFRNTCITSITIPSSVTHIDNSAFDSCNKLTSISVDANNTKYDSRNNCNAIIETATNKLIAGISTTIVPTDVESIDDRAFFGITGITEVSLSASVKSIGEYAFYKCTNLKNVTIAGHITTIGENAFEDCKLEKFSINRFVPLNISNTIFDNIQNTTLYVPAGSKVAYEQASIWKDFKEIVEMEAPVVPGAIVFADAKVKNICVTNWDTNGDNELTKAEIEAITELGSAFTKTAITSFDELQYFTGLTSIGDGAFRDCTNLTRVTIPSSVTSIGNTAFYSCSGLEDITIPGAVTSIGGRAFYKCTRLASVTIPNSVTSVGQNSFQSCSGLTTLTIENATTSIGNYAFSGCSNLASVSLGNAVTSIGDYAFNGCSNLASVSLENSVTSIGQFAFSRCTTLSSIVIPNSISTIKDYTFQYCTSLANVTIPNNVTSIGSYVFKGCTSIENIIIPNAVTIIGQSAFEDCSGLKNITIPKSVTSIGSKAFYNTGIYTNASDGVFYVDKWACGYKGTMPSNATIAFDEGTYAVSASAFNSCNEIMEITIPNSVVIIDVMAFAYCSNLTTVTIGNSVTSIGSYAFDCSNLATVTVGATTPPTLGNYGLSSYFENNGSLYVPVGSKTAYKAADNWKNVLIIYENSPRIVFADATVKAVCVEKWDTDGDRELSEYEAGLVTSLDNAFYIKREQITSFDELRYFTGLTTIGSDDFNGCIALKSITIPSGVTTINPFAFNQSALETLSIDANNATFYSPSGSNAIINRSTKELVKGCKTTIIPDDVTSIGERAFYYCTGLTSVDIPNGVNSIADYAFQECSALVSVTIPNTVKSIGEMAFRNCPMTSINIPEGVETIGNNAFWNCTGLTSIVLPGSISSLGQYVFSGCTNLAIVTITDGIEAIGGSMFYSCRNLTSITIPSSVTSIGSSAFYGCSNLENITIPSSVASIGNYAFENCSALSSVTVEWQTPINISSSVFSNSNQSNATLYVPAGREAVYKTASYWKNFKEIVEVVAAGTEAKPFTCAEANELVAGLTAGTPTESEYYIKGKVSTMVSNFGYQSGHATFMISDDGTKNGEFTVSQSLYFSKQVYEGGRIPNIGDEVVICGKLINLNGTTHQTVNENCQLVSINGKTTALPLENGDLFSSMTADYSKDLFFVAGCSTGFGKPNSENIGCSVGYAVNIRPETYSGCPTAIDADYEGAVILPEWADGLELRTIAPSAFAGAKLTSIIIPATVWDIETNAFNGCTNLASVTLPEGVILNALTFSGCTSLTSIELPKNVKLMGMNDNHIFKGCTNLTSITVNDETPYELQDNYIIDDPSQVTLYVPAGSKAAYEAAPIWKDFNIEEKGVVWAVTSTDNIPAGTKYELDDITLTIGEAGSNDFAVNEWGGPYDETFKNLISGNGENGDKEGGTFYLFTPKKNGNLTVFVSQNPVKKLFVEESGRVMDAFNGISHEEITEGQYRGTYTIPVYANLTYKLYCAGSKLSFYGFTFEGRNDAEVANITFADEKVKTLCVAKWDTNNDQDLSLTEAAAVTDLGEVFKENSEITSFDELRFFIGLTDISGWEVFYNCNALTSVTIPANVTYLDGATFAGCSALEQISVDPGNTVYCTRQNGNAIIEKATNKLVVGNKTGEIPDGVTVIGAEAFHGRHQLQWIGIPESVTELENGAFAWCTGLEGVEIPSSVQKIGGWAFTSTSLWSVTLPESLTTIGENAFDGCENLYEVTVLNQKPLALQNAATFSNRANATLYVPVGSKAAYKAAPIWQDFNIVSAIPEGTIIPWGTEQAWEMKYVYFDEIGSEPGTDGAGHAWTDAEFDDSRWKTLTGPIARYDTDFSVVNTIWEKENSCYYLRRTFNLDEVNEQGYYFCSHHDDNIKVWINGTQVVDAGFNGRCQYHHIPASAFVKGTNTMAIYLDDMGGGANLDYCMTNFYFLKNVETGKYLNAGDGWRAVLADEGLPVKLYKQADGSYTIYFPYGSQNQQLLYRAREEGVFVDYSKDWAQYGVCPSWTFTDAGEGHIYIQSLTTDPTYGQEAMPGTYLGNNPSSNYVDGNITAGNNITWTVETLPARTETQKARLQELVTAANALGLDTSGEEAVLNNSETTYIDMLETIYELQNRINDEYNNVNAKVQDLNKLIACADAIGVSTNEAQAVADNPQNMESVNNAISTLRTTYIAKLGEGVDASLLPLDVTGAIINPSFAINDADGWSWKDGEDGPDFGSTTAEYRERTFDFHQTVSGLPNGSYLLKVKGFHRPGNKDDVFADYMQGTDNAKAKLYANGKSVTLKNAAAEAQEHEVDGWSGLDVTYNGQTRYIPHENYDANTWFLAGYYENELPFTVSDGTLTFGISLDEIVKDDWVCFDDFRLILSDNAIDVSQLPNAIYADDQTGNVGRTFTMDIKLKNEKAVRAYSFDLQLPEGVTIAKDANDDYEMELSGRHDSYAPTVNYVESSNTYRLATTSRVVGNDGVIMTLRLQVSDQMPTGKYFIRILNAIYTQADNYQDIHMPDISAKLTIGEKTYTKGDVNDDDDVDIADVVCVVNHVVGVETPRYYEAAADVTGDNDVTISDAAKIVDYIIGEIDALGPIAATVRRLALSRSLNSGLKTGILDVSTLNDALYANDLNVEPGKNALLAISLKNTETTNGYSFDLILPDGVTLAKDGNNKYLCELSSRHDKTHGVNIKYKEDTRTFSVLVYSQSSKSLSGNDGEVLTFTLAVTNALGNNATLSIQNCKYSLTSGAASVPLPREEVKLNKGPKGDADGNGKINMSDVIIMLSYILGENPENFNIYAADMNSDGKVTVTDVLLMYGLIP